MTVEAWVKAIFDHPVQDPAWYWADDAVIPDDDPALCVSMLESLFQSPEQLLRPYSNAQVNQGLWLVTGSSGSTISAALFDTCVPWPRRESALASIPCLYERCFALRCSEHLSHLDEPGANPLNSICYMWWDVFPGWPDKTATSPSQTDQLCLSAMARALELQSDPCSESALHGLGHWTLVLPRHTQPIIAEFIERDSTVRPELLRYAQAAYDSAVE